VEPDLLSPIFPWPVVLFNERTRAAVVKRTRAVVVKRTRAVHFPWPVVLFNERTRAIVVKRTRAVVVNERTRAVVVNERTRAVVVKRTRAVVVNERTRAAVVSQTPDLHSSVQECRLLTVLKRSDASQKVKKCRLEGSHATQTCAMPALRSVSLVLAFKPSGQIRTRLIRAHLLPDNAPVLTSHPS
jgi:hypothetical protein